MIGTIGQFEAQASLMLGGGGASPLSDPTASLQDMAPALPPTDNTWAPIGWQQDFQPSFASSLTDMAPATPAPSGVDAMIVNQLFGHHPSGSPAVVASPSPAPSPVSFAMGVQQQQAAARARGFGADVTPPQGAPTPWGKYAIAAAAFVAAVAIGAKALR